MNILHHKSVSYEDALDAVICAEQGLPIKNKLAVNVSWTETGPVAVVEPFDLEDINLTGEENECYILIKR